MHRVSSGRSAWRVDAPALWQAQGAACPRLRQSPTDPMPAGPYTRYLAIYIYVARLRQDEGACEGGER